MVNSVPPILLIVEDEEVLLRALYLVFHDSGYTIASATDGENALKMAERLKPNLILLDLIIPKMDGFQFLRNIKANSNLKDIPVVVLSNLGDPEDIVKAKSLGAIDYFVKAQTDLTTLSEKVSNILNTYNAK